MERFRRDFDPSHLDRDVLLAIVRSGCAHSVHLNNCASCDSHADWLEIRAERDRLQADLTSLRAAVADQVTDIRKWAEGDRAVQAHLENLGKADEAEAYDATSKSLDVVADRLNALLDPDTSKVGT